MVRPLRLLCVLIGVVPLTGTTPLPTLRNLAARKISIPNSEDLEDLEDIDIHLDGHDMAETLRIIGVVLTTDREENSRAHSDDDPTQPLLHRNSSNPVRRYFCYIGTTVLVVASVLIIIGILTWKHII